MSDEATSRTDAGEEAPAAPDAIYPPTPENEPSAELQAVYDAERAGVEEEDAEATERDV